MRVIFHPKCSRCQVLNNPNELYRSRYRGKEGATALLVHGARGFNLQVPEHALYSSWLLRPGYKLETECMASASTESFLRKRGHESTAK